MTVQAERFGAKTISETVTNVDVTQRPFVLTTESNTYRVKAIIIATGASAKYALPHICYYVVDAPAFHFYRHAGTWA